MKRLAKEFGIQYNWLEKKLADTSDIPINKEKEKNTSEERLSDSDKQKGTQKDKTSVNESNPESTSNPFFNFAEFLCDDAIPNTLNSTNNEQVTTVDEGILEAEAPGPIIPASTPEASSLFVENGNDWKVVETERPSKENPQTQPPRSHLENQTNIICQAFVQANIETSGSSPSTSQVSQTQVPNIEVLNRQAPYMSSGYLQNNAPPANIARSQSNNHVNQPNINFQNPTGLRQSKCLSLKNCRDSDHDNQTDCSTVSFHQKCFSCKLRLLRQNFQRSLVEWKEFQKMTKNKETEAIDNKIRMENFIDQVLTTPTDQPTIQRLVMTHPSRRPTYQNVPYNSHLESQRTRPYDQRNIHPTYQQHIPQRQRPSGMNYMNDSFVPLQSNESVQQTTIISQPIQSVASGFTQENMPEMTSD